MSIQICGGCLYSTTASIALFRWVSSLCATDSAVKNLWQREFQRFSCKEPLVKILNRESSPSLKIGRTSLDVPSWHFEARWCTPLFLNNYGKWPALNTAHSVLISNSLLAPSSFQAHSNTIEYQRAIHWPLSVRLAFLLGRTVCTLHEMSISDKHPSSFPSESFGIGKSTQWLRSVTKRLLSERPSTREVTIGLL